MTGSISTALPAAICGLLLTVQVAANRRLGDVLASPIAAAAVSFLVGLAALILCLALMRQLPHPSSLGRAPWWAWTGGVMGAIYIAATIFLLPRMGSLALMSIVIGGQILAALLMDHYGWLGVPVHSMSLPRLGGAMLLMAGVAVVLRY